MMHEVATTPLEMILTAIGIGFWLLFPIGMFISVAHVDKNTDQIIQLEHHRHKPLTDSEPTEEKLTSEDMEEEVPIHEAPRPPAGDDRWLHQ